MTRAHVRLLGPCFKTGRARTQNKAPPTGAVNTVLGREPTAGEPTGRTGVRRRKSIAVLPASRTLARAVRHRRLIPSEARPGHPRPDGAGFRHPGRLLAWGRRPASNGSRRPTKGEVRSSETLEPRGGRSAPPNRLPYWGDGSSRRQGTGPREDVNLPLRNFRPRPFTPERFHVLLNSLFKVLFNFPSRYLFAIGLVVIFSLRWSLPPT